MGKFIIKQTATGYTFRLNACNGECVATSEVYTTENACKNGIESVKKNASTAPIEDQCNNRDYAKKANPKFEMFIDKEGSFRFRLKARNGEIIAVSEGYRAKVGCQKGIASVKKNAADAMVEMTKE